MLKDSFSTIWLRYSGGLKTELAQSADEGKDISGYKEKVGSVLEIPEERKREAAAQALMEEMAALPTMTAYKYPKPTTKPKQMVATLN